MFLGKTPSKHSGISLAKSRFFFSAGTIQTKMQMMYKLWICSKRVTFSYSILTDPDKRRQYDTPGFEAVESDGQELELDLSSLGAVNTMFAAIFSKLGVPIKTTVSATVLEEALNGVVTIHSLPLGQPLRRKVEKQCAHFYSVTITEKEAQAGVVCRVYSSDRSKFKLLYFDQDDNGGLSLALQEDSSKAGKVTSAGMNFLGFPVYRMDAAHNSITAVKDPDAAFKFQYHLK